jgi:hypothetical protein
MTYLTVPQLAKKYGFYPNLIYRLIREGFPFKWEVIRLEAKRKKDKVPMKFKPRKVMMVSEEDWLDIPTFIRNKWRRGENRLKVKNKKDYEKRSLLS